MTTYGVQTSTFLLAGEGFLNDGSLGMEYSSTHTRPAYCLFLPSFWNRLEAALLDSQLFAEHFGQHRHGSPQTYGWTQDPQGKTEWGPPQRSGNYVMSIQFPNNDFSCFLRRPTLLVALDTQPLRSSLRRQRSSFTETPAAQPLHIDTAHITHDYAFDSSRH